VLGTPSYMPPESVAGERWEASVAGDVYGLGAIFYELLSGRPPFEAPTALQVLAQVVEQEPRPPRSLDPRIDRDCETISLKCLEKDPARRYDSALALAEDLERWLALRPILARRSTLGERTLKWMRRRPLVAALSGIVGLVAALGTVGIVWQWRRAEQALAGAQAALQRAESQLYVNHVDLAAREAHVGNFSRVRELLERCPESRRAWEWHYLAALGEGALHTLVGHRQAVAGAAFAPDGAWVASAGLEGTVRIWETASGRALRTLSAAGPASSLAVSPAGDRIAAGTLAGDVEVWEAATGRPLWRQRGLQGAVAAVAFSADGRRLAAGSYTLPIERGFRGPIGTLAFWDVATGRPLRQAPVVTRSLAFLADGRLLTADGEGVTAWTVAGAPQRLFAGTVMYVAASPAGDRVAVVDREGGTRIVGLDGHPVVRLPTAEGARLAYSPDGTRLAVTQGSQVVLHDALSGAELSRFWGHDDPILTVAFSRDGRRLATGASDRTLRLWDATAVRTREWSLAGVEAVRTLTYSPDSSVVAVSDDHSTITLIDVASGRRLYTRAVPGGRAWKVAFSDDSRLMALASAEGVVSVLDTRSGTPLSNIKAHGADAWNVAFRPDNKAIATVGADHSVKVWELAGGRELARFPDAHTFVWTLLFSPDGGRLLAAGSTPALGSNEARLFDLASGKEIEAVRGPGSWATFSPDGKRFAASVGRVISVRDASTGAEQLVLQGHVAEVRALAFSPDGRRLASASADGIVKVWDAGSGAELLDLAPEFAERTRLLFEQRRGHPWSVDIRTSRFAALAFGRDGLRLREASLTFHSTGGTETELRFWNAPRREVSRDLAGVQSR